MCASNEYDATTDRYFLNQKSPTYPPNRPVYICISDIYIYIYEIILLQPGISPPKITMYPQNRPIYICISDIYIYV